MRTTKSPPLNKHLLKWSSVYVLDNEPLEIFCTAGKLYRNGSSEDKDVHQTSVCLVLLFKCCVRVQWVLPDVYNVTM